MNNSRKQLSDTPWHMGYAKMDESDTRRHRAHCLFYNHDTKECMTYKEQIRFDDKIADMLGIEQSEPEKYEQIPKEIKVKQQKLVSFVWSFLELKIEEEKIFEVVANRISTQSQGLDILDSNQRKELEKHVVSKKVNMEFSEKTMGREWYRNTIFIFILVMKKLLISRKCEYLKYLKNIMVILDT